MQNAPPARFFLGCNSPRGFCSLYDSFQSDRALRRVWLIKGGPGCGKSTLMRRVAARMDEAGLAVEYVLCSGDPDSLDAIAVPALGCALCDATAPHVLEPKCPGVVDGYLSLQSCYDLDGLAGRRDEFEQAKAGYTGCYDRAYRCLGAAAALLEDCRALTAPPEPDARLAKRARGILSRECRPTGGPAGQERARFLSAHTCKGLVRLTDTAEGLCSRVYELSDRWGLSHGLLRPLADGATAAGYDVIACPSPLFPDRLEHLLIPSLSLAFLSTSPDGPALSRRPARRVRLDAMADQDAVRRCRGRLRFSRKMADALLDEAHAAMSDAKAMHDDLEALYRPHIDFDKVSAIADRVAEEFLAM